MIIESLSGVRAHDKDMNETFLKAYAAAFVQKPMQKELLSVEILAKVVKKLWNSLSKVSATQVQK